MLTESFFQTHRYLVEHCNAPVRRTLMDEIDWSDKLIGIKGSRGVGKTTFLLQYAKENFDLDDKQCLYVNMNSFYFQGQGITDFASEFVAGGGKVLLIDQVFKEPEWSKQLRECHERFPSLKIIFTGSSVMRLKDENPELNGIVRSYNLRGFSFREYLNLVTGNDLPRYTLHEIIKEHQVITKQILPKVSPSKYFDDYLRKGYYPFFLENRNFSENLVKTMNMMTEVDILLIKQIELKYLSKIKKLFYLLAINGPKAPNISQLAQQVDTSRATVMNYIKYLADARLINIIYTSGQQFPKKPAKVMLHNSNLLYAIDTVEPETQDLMETFFVNNLWKDHHVVQGVKPHTYVVDQHYRFRVTDAHTPSKHRYNNETINARYHTEVGGDNHIPLWLLGFLY